jgi:hypothetical protein
VTERSHFQGPAKARNRGYHCRLKGLNDAEAAEAMAAAMGMSVEVSGAAHLPESVIHKIRRWQL